MTSQPESPVATKFVKRDDAFWRNVDEVSKKVRANPEMYGDHRRPKIMESKDEPVGGTRTYEYFDRKFKAEPCLLCKRRRDEHEVITLKCPIQPKPNSFRSSHDTWDTGAPMLREES